MDSKKALKIQGEIELFVHNMTKKFPATRFDYVFIPKKDFLLLREYATKSMRYYHASKPIVQLDHLRVVVNGRNTVIVKPKSEKRAVKKMKIRQIQMRQLERALDEFNKNTNQHSF